jgi:hypothetical protein
MSLECAPVLDLSQFWIAHQMDLVSLGMCLGVSTRKYPNLVILVFGLE